MIGKSTTVLIGKKNHGKKPSTSRKLQCSRIIEYPAKNPQRSYNPTPGFTQDDLKIKPYI